MTIKTKKRSIIWHYFWGQSNGKVTVHINWHERRHLHNFWFNGHMFSLLKSDCKCYLEGKQSKFITAAKPNQISIWVDATIFSVYWLTFEFQNTKLWNKHVGMYILMAHTHIALFVFGIPRNTYFDPTHTSEWQFSRILLLDTLPFSHSYNTPTLASMHDKYLQIV